MLLKKIMEPPPVWEMVEARDGAAEREPTLTFPDDLSLRATDGLGRDEALRLASEAAKLIGPDASVFDAGVGMEIRAVDPSVADVEAVERIGAGSPVPISVVSVSVSESWLYRTGESLGTIFRDDDEIVIGIDRAEWTLTLSAPSGPDGSLEPHVVDAARAAIADALRRADRSDAAPGLDANELIDFRVGRVRLTADVRNNAPIKSGRWVNTTSPLMGACTAGYLVYGGGNFRFTTAAHCFDGAPSLTVKMSGGTSLGSRTQSQPGGWDVANFSIPAAYAEQAAVTVDSAGSYRQIVASINPTGGTTYCFTGRAIVNVDKVNEKCNPNLGAILHGGKWLHCIERRTRPGDSGGPVYHIRPDYRVSAAGTMVLSYEIENSWPYNDEYYACFNPIKDLEEAGNWSVVLWK